MIFQIMLRPWGRCLSSIGVSCQGGAPCTCGVLTAHTSVYRFIHMCTCTCTLVCVPVCRSIYCVHESIYLYVQRYIGTHTVQMYLYTCLCTGISVHMQCTCIYIIIISIINIIIICLCMSVWQSTDIGKHDLHYFRRYDGSSARGVVESSIRVTSADGAPCICGVLT